MEMLGDTDASPESISLQTLNAAKKAFDIARSDPALYHNYWLLTQATHMSRNEHDFVRFLEANHLNEAQASPALKFIANLSEKAQEDSKQQGSRSIYGDMANMSMREVLTERLIQNTDLLFGSTTEDVRLSLKEISTKTQFGHIAKRYFGNLLSRVIKYYLNKDISNHVGVDVTRM